MEMENPKHEEEAFRNERSFKNFDEKEK